jgi:hypothetical protein
MMMLDITLRMVELMRGKSRSLERRERALERVFLRCRKGNRSLRFLLLILALIRLVLIDVLIRLAYGKRLLGALIAGRYLI